MTGTTDLGPALTSEGGNASATSSFDNMPAAAAFNASAYLLPPSRRRAPR